MCKFPLIKKYYRRMNEPYLKTNEQNLYSNMHNVKPFSNEQSLIKSVTCDWNLNKMTLNMML